MTWQLKVRNNGARRKCSLLGNGSINKRATARKLHAHTSHKNRGSVGGDVFDAVRLVVSHKRPGASLQSLDWHRTCTRI
jgi:hypothetical protein